MQIIQKASPLSLTLVLVFVLSCNSVQKIPTKLDSFYISGTITDQNMRPLNSGRIRLTNVCLALGQNNSVLIGTHTKEEKIISQTRSDKNGLFVLGPVIPGEYLIRGSAPGYFHDVKFINLGSYHLPSVRLKIVQDTSCHLSPYGFVPPDE